MNTQAKEIRRYITTNGKIPFAKWFDSLKDRKTQLKITQRLRRASLGNLGDFKSVGKGVFELRINYGAGYRIYFGQDESIFLFIKLLDALGLKINISLKS